MSLLDIGCTLPNTMAAVVGITISEEQRRYAAEFCRGLPMEIRLQDYRELSEQFDCGKEISPVHGLVLPAATERFYRMWRFYLLSCAEHLEQDACSSFNSFSPKERYDTSFSIGCSPRAPLTERPHPGECLRIREQSRCAACVPENDVFVFG
jgi:hypothetical protein